MNCTHNRNKPTHPPRAAPKKSSAIQSRAESTTRVGGIYLFFLEAYHRVQMGTDLLIAGLQLQEERTCGDELEPGGSYRLREPLRCHCWREFVDLLRQRDKRLGGDVFAAITPSFLFLCGRTPPAMRRNA
jgi:hypothetical protein